MKFARRIDDGVRELVSSCSDLEFLSVIGCEFMNLDQTVIMENFPRLTLECDSPAKSWDFSIGNKDDDDFWSAPFGDSLLIYGNVCDVRGLPIMTWMT